MLNVPRVKKEMAAVFAASDVQDVEKDLQSIGTSLELLGGLLVVAS